MPEIKKTKKPTEKRVEHKQFVLEPVEVNELEDRVKVRTNIFSIVTQMFRRFTSRVSFTKGVDLIGILSNFRMGSSDTEHSTFFFFRTDVDPNLSADKYEMFFENNMVIQPTSGNDGNFTVGDTELPLISSIKGEDEVNLNADDSSDDCNLLIEPTKATFTQSGSDKFKLGLPNHSIDPSTCVVGELAVVGGKLKICTSTNVFTVVGTQT